MEKNCLIKNSEFANYLFYLVHYCVEGKKNNKLIYLFPNEKEELFFRQRYSLRFPYIKIGVIGNDSKLYQHMTYLSEIYESQVINGGRNVKIKYHRALISSSTRQMGYSTISSLKNYITSRTDFQKTKEYIDSRSSYIDQESKPVSELFRCIIRLLKTLNYLGEDQISFFQNSKNLDFNCFPVGNMYGHFRMIIKLSCSDIKVTRYDENGKLLETISSILYSVENLNKVFEFIRKVLSEFNAEFPNDKNFEF